MPSPLLMSPPLSTPGRLRFEDDPAEVADNSVVTYAALGGAALALILVIVACCLCVCLRRKNRENYLPPKLTAAQERDLMFGKVCFLFFFFFGFGAGERLRTVTGFGLLGFDRERCC